MAQKHWYNNTEQEKRCLECLEGWVPGRLNTIKEKLKEINSVRTLEQIKHKSELISQKNKGRKKTTPAWNKGLKGKQVAWNKGLKNLCLQKRKKKCLEKEMRLWRRIIVNMELKREYSLKCRY